LGGGAIGKKKTNSERKFFCDFAPLLQFSIKSSLHTWDPHKTKTLVAS
jgi:hypothetical protein